MNEDTYLVTITNENDKINGTLQEKKNGSFLGKQANFDPLTVLGDLLNIAIYVDLSPYPQDNYSFKTDYLKHPFFLGQEFKGNTLFKKPLCFIPFFVAFNELKILITNNKTLSMSEFEILKQFLSLKFTYRIEFREENPLYKLGYKINPINNEKVYAYQYTALNETYNFDMETMFNENNDTTYKFTYSCHSIEDIIFSVWHFLMLQEYQFNKCNHCDNYFATKTLKHKYCDRKSLYKNFENLDCGQAVKNIKQKLRRRKNVIDNGFRQNTQFQLYDEKTRNKFYKFEDLCHEYSVKIKKHPSVQNFEEYENYLYDPQFKKGRYSE